ncbi:MAG: ATP-dependent DNA ligase, partial [Actinobacteria bacterium]|nr:ATP-dependent DNA ligase [Actinomycetota bacterium]
MAAAQGEVLDIGGREVRISSPEKPYFADLGVNKLGVVRYFLSVGDGIL